jgi:hypothetical protein
MGSPHRMPGVFGRWWRWWTNPEPCPGEVWTLPSLGGVLVVPPETNDRGGYVRFMTQARVEFVWSPDRFRERATFGPPTAVTLFSQGDPR